MGTEYMQQTAEDFLRNLDRIQAELAGFSKEIDAKSETVAMLLENFESQCEEVSLSQSERKNDPISMALAADLTAKNEALRAWRSKIEKDRKGREFMHKHEKYLVVMVFGAVKSGKSTLGNFFGGKYFRHAKFDNAYKLMPVPIFETEEEGRKKGGFEQDENGETWFEEGVTDTTGSIQYFTLSGLRWMDSPGIGAVGKTGDSRRMDEMVDEYISYADMCIFLMNSAEPGLQKDMRYMEKLSREGQEAIIVITRSDMKKPKVTADGIKRYCVPKPEETRRKQEEDVCRRTLAAYPNIKEEHCRAISVSTLLAKQGIEDGDEEKYRAGNLDLLMEILGKKAAGDAANLKEKRPRKAFNSFIDEILSGNSDSLATLETSLFRVKDAIADNKRELDNATRTLELSCKREIRRDVLAAATSWEEEVKKSGMTLSADEISSRVADIAHHVLQKRINETVSKIIADYKSREMESFSLFLNTKELEKKTETNSFEYFTWDYVERAPQGFVESVKSFLFDKKYYRAVKKKHVVSQVIDMGTNLEEICDELLPQLEKEIKTITEHEMARLRDSYFIPQEKYVESMSQSLQELKNGLKELKFSE